MTMKPTDFHIGLEFWCSGRQWRCTDVGTRTVIAIRIDGADLTVSQSGSLEKLTLSGREAEDRGWFNGPPYAVAEHVFDENDLEACSLTPED